MECAVSLQPNSNAYGFLADILITTENPDLRNPRLALKYATKACDLTKWSAGDFLELLAAAYARDDQFGEAMRVQGMAVQRYEEERLDKRLDPARRVLACYKKRVIP